MRMDHMWGVLSILLKENDIVSSKRHNDTPLYCPHTYSHVGICSFMIFIIHGICMNYSKIEFDNSELKLPCEYQSVVDRLSAAAIGDLMATCIHEQVNHRNYQMQNPHIY